MNAPSCIARTCSAIAATTQLGFIGHGADIDAKQAGDHVGGVGNASADRVGQSELVPEDAAQSVGEPRSAAEDVVEHGQGFEVGMVAGNPEVAQDDVNLFARLGDAANPRPGRADEAGIVRQAPGTRLPALEVGFHQARQRLGVEVAGRDQERVVGREVGAVMGLDVGSVSRAMSRLDPRGSRA